MEERASKISPSAETFGGTLEETCGGTFLPYVTTVKVYESIYVRKCIATYVYVFVCIYKFGCI